jgi:hypothetical protein
LYLATGGNLSFPLDLQPALYSPLYFRRSVAQSDSSSYLVQNGETLGDEGNEGESRGGKEALGDEGNEGGGEEALGDEGNEGRSIETHEKDDEGHDAQRDIRKVRLLFI